MPFKLRPRNGKDVQALNNGGRAPESLPPKLICGKVWVADPLGGYRRLPENDPTYHDLFFQLNVQDLLTSIYDRKKSGSRKRKS